MTDARCGRELTSGSCLVLFSSLFLSAPLAGKGEPQRPRLSSFLYLHSRMQLLSASAQSAAATACDLTHEQATCNGLAAQIGR